MTEDRKPFSPDGGSPGPAHDDTAPLLRLAGARPVAPADATARVRAAALAQWRATVALRRRRRTLYAVASVAAVLVLALAIGPAVWRTGRDSVTGGPAVATLARASGAILMDGSPPLAEGAPLRSGATLTTAPGARALLRLAAGPSIRIDADARVRLAGGASLALDRGAIYVDSGPGAGPEGVEVRTGLGTVRDIGTRFEVRLNGGLRVTVREGSARVEREGRVHEAGAGNRVTVAEDGTVAAGPAPMHGPEWEWILAVSPPFELEGSTLAGYLEWVTRETGLRVEFEPASLGPGAARIVLHGTVARMRPDETLAAVLPTCGLRHRLTDGAIVIEPE